MQIEIKNFLGVEDAVIPLIDKPLAVIGPNASGKSSMWLAIAGILSRNTNPMGLTAASGRPYIHDDHDQGEVTLDDDGTALRRWTLTEKGMRVMPEAETDSLTHCLGLTDFVQAKAAERTKVWEECFLPPNEELLALIGTNLSELIAEEAVVEDVLRELGSTPWAKVCAVYESKRQESKRQWEEYSGVRYGANKADTWTPKGWKSEWDQVTVAESKTRLEEWREALRMLLAVQVVQEADVERAAEAREQIPDLEKKVRVEADQLEAALQHGKIVQEKYKVIRDQGLVAKNEINTHNAATPKKKETVACPSCKSELVIGPGQKLTLDTDERAFQAILSNWKTVGDQMHSELEGLRARGVEILREKQPIDREIAEIKKEHLLATARAEAARRAAKLGEGEVETDKTRRQQAEAEQAVDDAKAATYLIESKTNARNAHISALSYDAIAKALGPQGIRARALQGPMDALERYLDTLADLSEWPQVRIDRTYEVKIGPRYGKLSSESERWRANFMIQCAIALVKKEKRVVVDRADILDASSARQLWRLSERLVEMGVFPIVCATHSMESPPAEWESVFYEFPDGWGVAQGFDQGSEERTLTK